MRRILLVGVGGAGTLVSEYLQWQLGLEALAVNTDRDALKRSQCNQQLLIGAGVCNGLPAHSPDRGRRAAESSLAELKASLTDAGQLIVIAGLGGGTGTGATSVVIDLATSLNLDTFAVLILPFSFETQRRRIALIALRRLQTRAIPMVVRDLASVPSDHDSRHESMLDGFEQTALAISDAVDKQLLIHEPDGRTHHGKG